MMNKKRVLISGGSGFLGGYLVDHLLYRGGYTIVVFDKLEFSSSRNYQKDLQYIQGDILSKQNVKKVFHLYGPFHTVFHLASAMPDKAISDQATWETNVTGTVNVVSEAVRYGTESFIFTSSNVTYGIPQFLPVTETTPAHPLEVYGKSKLEAEHLLETYKKRIHIQIFRCPVVTGVGRLGLQSILFEFISENRNVYVLGDGLNKYQFVDAIDVCTALEKASYKQGFDIYTIGGDGVMTIKELYQKVIDSARSSSKIVPLPKAPALAVLWLLDRLNISPLGVYQYTMLSRSMYADTSKIKKQLRWKPKKTNAQSFIENYQWYVHNKKTFRGRGKSNLSANRSLVKMKAFKLLKILS